MDVSAHDAYLDGYLALVDKLDDETRARVGPDYAFIFKYLYPRVYGLRKGGGAGQVSGTPSASLSNPSDGKIEWGSQNAVSCTVFRVANGKNVMVGKRDVGARGSYSLGDARIAGTAFFVECKGSDGTVGTSEPLVIAGTTVTAGNVAA